MLNKSFVHEFVLLIKNENDMTKMAVLHLNSLCGLNTRNNNIYFNFVCIISVYTYYLFLSKASTALKDIHIYI